MEDNNQSPVYQRDVIEFVTVAVQYCAYLEDFASKDRAEAISTTLKLLPLLYLKGELLPQYELLEDVDSQDFVTEEEYDSIRSQIAMIMGEQDDFLDVFVEDMKYSETPILCTISECMADIYQDLKNFVCAYRLGTEDTMMNALAICKSNYESYWGLRLTNVLRALHEAKYQNLQTEDDYE